LRLSNIDGSYFGYSNTQITALASSLRFNVAGAELMRLIGTSVLIGTTTNSGYKLDVNGTGNYEGNLRLGVGFQLLFNNNNVGLYRDANTLRLGGFGGVEILSSATNISSQSIRMKIFDTGNVAINTTTDAGYKLDVNGTARVVGTAVLGRVNFSSNDADGQLRFVGNSLVYNPTGSASLSSTSAGFEITSTTKGFLPPRMTQTQRNAIASPAIGLEIYQTDATEGKYIYKSSGWTYIG
jgi:hypothetical protein